MDLYTKRYLEKMNIEVFCQIYGHGNYEYYSGNYVKKSTVEIGKTGCVENIGTDTIIVIKYHIHSTRVKFFTPLEYVMELTIKQVPNYKKTKKVSL
jgi:hypothetical protein